MDAKEFCVQVCLISISGFRAALSLIAWTSAHHAGARTLKAVTKYPPIISSRSNARVKSLRASFSGKSSRPGELVGIEGRTLIGEAAKSGVHFDTIYYREDSVDTLPEALAANMHAERWLVLSNDVFDSAVGAMSPQGVAATVSIPEQPALGEGVVLMLEDLQDPGNLGTLLRSAEAFGVRCVFATHASVNAWNSKAIRASAGSVFRVPVVRCSVEQMKVWAQERSMKLFAAVARTQSALSVTQACLLPPCALMIGNEGAGLSEAALALCDERVHIPCAVESLNAATAGTTLMYEALRQRMLNEREDLSAAEDMR
jgi:TrmH family RNA methyltransferase